MKRILIVDDDADIRRSLGRILRSNGFEVVEAANGEQAFEVGVAHRPDLLILDIRMPGIDGVEAFAQVRRAIPAVPAIFMTAYSTSERAVAASRAGAISVLSKPLDLQVLLGIIEHAIAAAPVLIVDDQVDFRKSLSRSLAAAGIRNTCVSSLDSAASEIRKRPERVVIADVFLDDGSGLQLLAEFSAGVDPPPLILVSGHADWFTSSETADELARRNIRCLAKPLDIDRLVAAVRDLQSTAAGDLSS